MIVLDTSVLIDALTGGKRSSEEMRRALAEGRRILLPALALYEWLRGPRLSEELAMQEELVPAASAIPFAYEEATISAGLYRTVKRPRPGPRSRTLDTEPCRFPRRTRSAALHGR